MSKSISYFTKSELVLWSVSVIFILLSFALFDRESYITLAASLVGATSLIFNAKGNPIGQFLMVIFSVLYGVISFTFDYYGEMITYLGMTGPMALFALITWIKNPYNGNKSEVRVNTLTKREIVFMFVLSGIVTWVFYYILVAFDTANIVPSTISVTTSFLGVYLTFRRNEYFPLAYACNDIVLIILWTLAAITDISYVSVIICFIMFFINDMYGFINWSRIKKRQMNLEME